MNKKRIDEITVGLTDELFALAMLHELLAQRVEARPMVEMCQTAVGRCQKLTACLSLSGAQAMRHAAAPESVQRVV